MTRKRSGKTLVQQLMCTCPTCNSFGYIRSYSTISFDILQQFEREAIRKNITGHIALSVQKKVFEYLIHSEFQSILELEKKLNCKIILEINEKLRNSQFSIEKIKETS